MSNFLLTTAATAALLIGGLTWTDTADARPRGWYRSAPAVRYYRPYYGYRTYYRPYYGYQSYYSPYYSYPIYSGYYGAPYGSYYYGPYARRGVYVNWW
jgi:hypothetical protein